MGAAWWDAADADARWEAIHAAVEKVTVKPATRRGSRFDESRVVIDFDQAVLDRVAGVSWLAVHDAVIEAEASNTRGTML
jgi:hypothetical protein